MKQFTQTHHHANLPAR